MGASDMMAEKRRGRKQGGKSQRNELLANLRSMINNNVMEISISKEGQWVVIGSAVGGQTAVEGRTVFVLDL